MDSEATFEEPVFGPFKLIVFYTIYQKTLDQAKQAAHGREVNYTLNNSYFRGRRQLLLDRRNQSDIA